MQMNEKKPERKKRFAPANAPMGGGRGPGGGRGGAGRFMEKPKLKDGKGTILRLLGYLKHVKWYLITALIALVGSSVATLSAPKISGRLIDSLIDSLKAIGEAKAAGLPLKDVLAHCYGALAQLGGLLATVYVCAAVFHWLQQIMLVDVAQKTVRRLRQDLFERMQKLPLRFFDAHPHGQLMSRLTNDVDNVSMMLGNTLTQFFSGIITLSVSLFMMLSISWQLTLTALITIPLSMFVVGKVTKFTGRLFKAQQAALGELNGIVEETVTGARVVKVFGREKQVIDEFNDANDELREVGTKATILSSIMGPLMNCFNNCSYALVTGIGAFLAVGGVVTIGNIQSFLQYSRQFARPINEIAHQITTIQSALAGAERVFEIMDTEPEPTDAADAYVMKDTKGDVFFDDVTFGYTAEKNILQNVSFDVKAGQTIAIVGPTGAGKTTIVNLLMRFYDLNGGKIYIDGHDITTVQRQSLRDGLGMVLQDVYLFAGTVRDNIAYGRLDATDKEIIEAAKLANCHEFITRLPKGYYTELSEDGSNLSQGQRQLLSIARAILANPSILILDEATSSVDTRTEMKIQEAMLELMKGRTSFVIAHRLSTIRHADMIMVISGGSIIERGTHEELVAQNGFYANMLNSQFRAAKAVG